MKKYLLVSIIVLAAWWVLGSAHTTEAATINAASCSQTDVQTAITSASDGDTVILPACTATWSSVLSFSKAITLQGAGIDQTNIICTQGCSSTNYAGAIQITAHATQNTRVTGFTFVDNNSCLFGVSGAYNNASKVRLDHINFNSGLATFVRWKDNQPGLIDHNIFPGYGGGEKMQISGNSAADWARPDNMGSADLLYIEDNTFNCSPNNTCMVSNAWGGARFVVRHNTLVNATVDGHGQDYWNYSVRQMEIYNNTWPQMQGAAAIYFRGGTGVIFNNTAPGGTWGTGLLVYEICREAYTGCCTTYPCIQQVGRGQNYGSSPVYLWDNTNLAVWHSCGGQFDCAGMDDSDAATFIQENRDFKYGIKPGYSSYTYPHPLTLLDNNDTQSPTIPTNLFATAVSSSQINLSWAASTDNFGVTGYRIYRGGTQIGISATNSYSDTGLSPSTTYTYTVAAYDAAGNVSAQSSSASATTQTPSANIEAESGTLASPMQVVSDSSASGNAYIMTPTSESGTAAYSFSIASAGIYKIVARVYAQNAGTDSFYFKIDNLAEDTWDLNPLGLAGQYGVWREDEVTKRGIGAFDAPQYDPYTVNLTAGSHTLTFRGRETNAKLDYFYLVKIIDTTPPAAPSGVRAQ